MIIQDEFSGKSLQHLEGLTHQEFRKELLQTKIYGHQRGCHTPTWTQGVRHGNPPMSR